MAGGWICTIRIPAVRRYAAHTTRGVYLKRYSELAHSYTMVNVCNTCTMMMMMMIIIYCYSERWLATSVSADGIIILLYRCVFGKQMVITVSSNAVEIVIITKFRRGRMMSRRRRRMVVTVNLQRSTSHDWISASG